MEMLTGYENHRIFIWRNIVKKALVCLSFIILIMSLSAVTLWSDCPCNGTAVGPGPGGISTTGNFIGIAGNPQKHLHMPVGNSAIIGCSFSDGDVDKDGNSVNDSINTYNVTGSGWTDYDSWVDGCLYHKGITRQTYFANGSEGGSGYTDTIHLTATDKSMCGSGNDPDLDIAFQVDWVGIDSLIGPFADSPVQCANVFSVRVTPAAHDTDTANAHCDFVKWYYSTSVNSTWVPLTSTSDGTYSTCDTRSLTPGEYVIWVRVEIPAAGIGNGIGPALSRSFVATAVPSESIYSAEYAEVDADSGCASGSCGAQPGSVGISLTAGKLLYHPLTVGSFGRLPGYADTDRSPSMEIAGSSCDQTIFRCTYCDAINAKVPFHNKSMSFPYWTYAESFDLTGGWKISSLPVNDGLHQTFKMTSPNGTTYSFIDLGLTANTDRETAQPSGTIKPRLTRVDSPDGTYVTYTIDGDGTGTVTGYNALGLPAFSNTFHFDAQGRITDYYNSDGTVLHASVRKCVYPERIQLQDSNGNILSETIYSLDTSGALIQVNHDGKITGYTYGNNLITVTNESASPHIVTEYYFGTNTTTITQKHPTDSSKDQVTTYEFFKYSTFSNSSKRYTWKITDPNGQTTKFGYWMPTGSYVYGKTENVDYKFTDNPNLYGKVFQVTDSSNNTTAYSYNSVDGTLTSITYPNGDMESCSYCAPTLPCTIRNTCGSYMHFDRGNTTKYRVDAIRISPISSQEPSNWSSIAPEVEFEYYPANDSHGQGGRLWKVRVPNVDDTNSCENTYEYYEIVNGVEKLRDDATRIHYKIWSGSAYVTRTTSVSYDSMGRILSATNADNRTIFFGYDLKGRLLNVIYQNSPRIADEAAYTCCNLDWTKDPDGREEHYGYDDAGRIAKAWTSVAGQSATNPLVAYAYDGFDNQTTGTVYSNATTPRTTSYTYDKLNRITKMDLPGPLGDEECGYDSLGRLQWAKDGNGTVTLYKYDIVDRLTDVYFNYTGSLTNITYPASSNVQFTFISGSSLPATVTDSAGASAYSFDYRNRLTSYSPPKPVGHGDITYTYNALGQKASITNGSLVISYSYYANGALRDVHRGLNLIASYTYDQIGNCTRVDYGNGTYQTFTYNSTDPRYQLEKINYAYRCASGQPVQVQGNLGLTYDNSENTVSWSVFDTSVPPINIFGKAYTYDQVSRLESSNTPGATTITYQSDWADNRINPGQLEYNDADQLTRVPGEHRYEYYANGDLHYTKDDYGALQETCAYTSDGFLSSVSYTGVSRSSNMTWDSAGNQITFQSSTRATEGETYTFVYDITAGVPAVIEERSTAGTCVYYIREPNGTLIARIVPSGASETIQYYHYDEQGSILFLTDANGVVTDKYAYDDWGNTISHAGSTQQPYQYVGALGYYTHYQDPNLKYKQLGLRFYNPQTARFTQMDPIADGLNWYAYCGSDPRNGVDPWGLFPWKAIGKAVAVKSYNILESVDLLPLPYTTQAFGEIVFGDHSAFAGEKWVRYIPFIGEGLYNSTDSLGLSWQRYTDGHGSFLTFLGDYAIWNFNMGGSALAIEGAGHGLLEGCKGTSGELREAYRRNPRKGSIGTGPSPRPSSRYLRRQWEKEYNSTWPMNHEVSHRIPRSEGGTDDVSNIFPEQHTDHVARHSSNGDFKRWGGMRGSKH